MSDFPRAPEQISNEWLSRVLGYTVSSHRLERLGEGGGLVGLVTRLHLDAESGPKTVIAKFPTLVPENRALADTYNMYRREYNYYTLVAADVPLHSPDCYHADFDDATNEFVLLLGDLQRYRLGDQVVGCTLEEAHQIVESIASLHRNTWQSEIKEILPHDMPYQRNGMIAGYQVGWPNVLQNFGHLCDEKFIESGAMVPDHVNSLLDQIHDGPLVISHGDVRLDNIFFTENGIALVDYQAVSKAAPEHDLAYFVTQSLPDDVRHREDWVSVYHQHLTRDGIGYSLETSRRRYRLCALYLLCYAVIIAGTLDTANERGLQLADTLLGNSIRSLAELKAFELIT